jgi:3-hydroxybutyryl-CoA dehydrogenase
VTGTFVVVGGGTMGTGIAGVAAAAAFTVWVVEPDAVRRKQARVVLERRGAEAGVSIVDGLATVPTGPDVVVEAVPEIAALKRELLAECEALEPALLGSNTSSISIGELAVGLARPERFCGLHFFNPVHKMELLEIVLGAATSESTKDAALALAARLGKQPVVVRDLPGFATSRLGVALGLEAIRMVADGVASPDDIDRAMVLGYRHPMGPLELGDVVGLDVRLAVARTLEAAYGPRYHPPDLLVDKVERGELGRKSGQGFYRWEEGRRV